LSSQTNEEITPEQVKVLYIKKLIEVVQNLKSISEDNGTPFGLLTNIIGLPDPTPSSSEFNITGLKDSVQRLRYISNELFGNILNGLTTQQAQPQPYLLDDYDAKIDQLKFQVDVIKGNARNYNLPTLEKNIFNEIIQSILDFQCKLNEYIIHHKIKMTMEYSTGKKPRTRAHKEYPQTLHAFDHLLERIYFLIYFTEKNDYSTLFAEFRKAKPWTKSLPSYDRL